MPEGVLLITYYFLINATKALLSSKTMISNLKEVLNDVIEVQLLSFGPFRYVFGACELPPKS